jgi:hypothetical protein
MIHQLNNNKITFEVYRNIFERITKIIIDSIPEEWQKVSPPKEVTRTIMEVIMQEIFKIYNDPESEPITKSKQSNIDKTNKEIWARIEISKNINLFLEKREKS